MLIKINQILDTHDNSVTNFKANVWIHQLLHNWRIFWDRLLVWQSSSTEMFLTGWLPTESVLRDVVTEWGCCDKMSCC